MSAATKLRPGLRDVALAKLRPSEDNPRSISGAGLERLKKQIEADPTFLKARPICAMPDGRIYAGEQRWRACRELGRKSAPTYVEEIDEARRRERMARDNAHGGDWVPQEVAALVTEHQAAGGDPSLFGFSEGELSGFLASVDTPEKRADPAAAIEPPTNPTTVPGELIQLGEHRLLCGDTTDGEDVKRLFGTERVDAVITDPPFAIYGSSSGLSSSVTDDKIVRPFFRDALLAAGGIVKLFGQVYVHCDWRSWPSWWEVAKGTSLEPKNLIAWDKGGSGLGNNWANTYELIGYFVHMPRQKAMKSDRPTGMRPVLKSNVIRANRPTGENRQHNAAKPTDLIAELIDAATEEGETVADLFAGSGSTLIACEEAGRTCKAMEIDPAWCDVIVARWERATGRKARRHPPK